MTVTAVRTLRNALDAVRSEHLSRELTAPRDDLIDRTHALGREAQAINIPQFAAVAALRRADMEIGLARLHAALASLQMARRHIHSLARDEHGVFLLRLEAQAYAGLGRWADVGRVCREGIAIVEPSRAHVSPLTLQNSYLRFRITLYELAVRAAVELQRWDDTLEITELVKCRSLSRLVAAPAADVDGQLIAEYRTLCDQIDKVVAQGGEVERLLARRRSLWHLLQIARLSGCGTPPQSVSLNDVGRQLAADEAVLNYFWMDPERLLVMAIGAEGAECVTVQVSAADRRKLTQIAEALQSASPPNSAADLPVAMTDLLIPAAIRHVVDRTSHLLISPHRVLHALPLHALRWGAGYLLETFAVTYLPNLSTLYRPGRAPARGDVLAVGVSHSNAPPANRFRPLPDAEDEIRELQALYGRNHCRVLLDDTATESELARCNETGELKNYDVLHFACHGLNIDSDNPMESKLFLRDSALDGLDIATWRIGARLVVLSACCSGQRPVSGRGLSELPGDDLFGLQAAFFAAGAEQIVSTMWPVDSTAARAITGAFYTLLRAGLTTHEALQQATAEFLNAARAAGNIKQDRPYTWAPFFLAACSRTDPELKETPVERLTIHFEVDAGFDAKVMAAEIEQRLGRITGVDRANADVEDERIGVAEVLAVITGVVILARTAREGAEELRRLIAGLRDLVQEVDGLRNAVLDFAGRRVPLDDPDRVVAELEEMSS